MNKDKLLGLIKEWIKCDEELKELQKNQKMIKTKKKQATDDLLEIMKTNEIDCFDISTGKLVYQKTKTRGSLNKKLLLESLGNFFNGRDDININELGNFLLDSREVKENENIKRK